MKKTAHFLVFVLTITTLLLSACGGAVTPNSGVGKVEAIPVAFTGIVESIAGDQWVINGQTVTVDPAVVRNGPFNAGDQVKVEGAVNPDGSFSVSRVETPSAQDLSTLPQFGDDNSNANVNDVNSNDVNSNDANSNDANVNADNSNTSGNENGANVNDDNNNTVNSNDDNGASGNSNDANSNDDNSNAGGNDNGGAGNDNGGGGDSGGGGNDNGGGGNDGGGGGDDNGGNGNGG